MSERVGSASFRLDFENKMALVWTIVKISIVGLAAGGLLGPGGFNDARSDNGSSFAAYNKRSGPVIHVDKLLKGSLKSISTT